jgi:hypothetical protein
MQAQTECGSDVLRIQKHSLAMTLLLANDTYRGIFEKNIQTKDAVKPTPLFYVCTDVYGTAKTKYEALSPDDKKTFDDEFTKLGKRIAFVSPNVAAYGGGGQCPQGLELHDLLK